MLATLKAEQFQPLVGKEFTIVRKLSGGETIKATLEKVDERENCKMPDAQNDLRIPFTLLFKSSASFEADSEICVIQHEGQEDIEDVFINRVIAPEPDSKDSWLEVVFC